MRKEQRNIYAHDGRNFNLINNYHDVIKEEKTEIYYENGIKAFRFDALKHFGSLSKIKKIGHVILNPKSIYNAKYVHSFNLLLKNNT